MGRKSRAKKENMRVTRTGKEDMREPSNFMAEIIDRWISHIEGSSRQCVKTTALMDIVEKTFKCRELANVNIYGIKSSFAIDVFDRIHRLGSLNDDIYRSIATDLLDRSNKIKQMGKNYIKERMYQIVSNSWDRGCDAFGNIERVEREAIANLLALYGIEQARTEMQRLLTARHTSPFDDGIGRFHPPFPFNLCSLYGSPILPDIDSESRLIMSCRTIEDMNSGKLSPSIMHCIGTNNG